ncbi:chemotaxis response regulator protein-glutamate methylesterase [Pseudoalteromonas sp. Cnat2-41]|uniref:protein-glutamate methylesterase/protein-glutamine glutaminase n=1 Tax=unclassified Pseudoalteromonas TaxID=194690 RepID=UPI001EF979B0|nr:MULTISPECIES: chemotaxis response regulator protein-glutamate methylesterase [unclassified Pseudoalteromonas]MCF2862508.1 chemotaxis response regulator protein-glutamate methylesterase [Pseudoalteromonas sp. CNAT2-18]MCG7559040.1 chemotaxis response regulator protein-glutamate methylesterase [Pseudoalteromonas sp. CNAT2-18.1]
MIRVLIIDDSALIQSLLKEIITDAHDMEVVGCASDPYQAREMIKQLNPDVLTLDIEMPKMDGISFLKNLMRLRPMPVVMISTLTQQGAPITLEALELGAVDFVAKPTNNVRAQMQAYAGSVQQKVRTAAKANIRRHSSKTLAPVTVQKDQQFKLNHLVAIGASTGGTEAIKEVITRLPENFPAVVITQHIPPVFSQSFAIRMNNVCAMQVHEASDEQVIKAGNIYIAPGGEHLMVQRKGGKLECRLSSSEPVNRHRPAVDVMFSSIVEQQLAKHTCALLLTGMGADGAKGLLQLKQAGAVTAAQDQASSVVWGMPKAAIDLGAAQVTLSLAKSPQWLIEQAKK